MPDKEEITTKDVKTSTKPEGVSDNRQNPRGLVIALLIAVLVILGLLIGGGIWVYRNQIQRTAFGGHPFASLSGERFGGGRSFTGYGTEVQTQINNDSTVTTTVYTYQTGVVVKINSDSIVIAGNGKQTTIKTNSSTTYVGGVKPVVNDTVVVAGTTAGSTVTATQIRVAN